VQVLRLGLPFGLIALCLALAIQAKADQFQNSPSQRKKQNDEHFDQSNPGGIHDASEPLSDLVSMPIWRCDQG
jgi:hypothetical protein